MSSSFAAICPRCGAELAASAAVCGRCGLRLAAAGMVPQSPASPGPPEATPDAGAPRTWAWVSPGGEAAPPAAAPQAGGWPAVAAPGPSWGQYPQQPGPLYPGALAWGAAPAPATLPGSAGATVRGPVLDAVLALLGGVALGVGAFLPWVTVSSPLGSASANGTDGTSDGYGFVALGAGAALLALLAAALRSRLRPRLGVLALLVGLGAAGFDAFEIIDVHRKASDASGGGVIASTGYGLWVLAAGAVAVVVGGLIAATRRRPTAGAAPLSAPPATLPYPPPSG